MKIAASLLIALLFFPCQSKAWIAYGFSSGMSRFDVARYLSERELQVITDGAERTLAASGDNSTEYDLVYCSTPQKLYLMKYSLLDSPAEFARILEKYERRYGKPEGRDGIAGKLQSANWNDVDISLMWKLNAAETILLTHNDDGTRAEFQDTSVCE